MSIEAAFFGSLSRDGELKTSKNGKPYLRLNVRIGDGDQAQWVSVTSFDPDAIAVSDKFTKGSRCYIEGSLRLDQWSGADGALRYGLTVLSWHTRLAGIGRNRPKRNDRVSVAGASVGSRPSRNTAAGDDFHNDPIPPL
jgi:single-stranded DNA-binding protein